MTSLPSVTTAMIVKDGADALSMLSGFLDGFDNVIVGDDGSTDDTKQVASSFGFEVIDVSELVTFKEKREATVDRARTEWIFMLDADERPLPGFVPLMQALIAGDPGVSAYQVNFRTYFAGQWLKHGGVYPLWVTRLFRRDAYRGFAGDVHERVLISGRTTRSTLECQHFSYEDTRHYLQKIQRYTDDEARELSRAATHTLLPPGRQLVMAATSVAREMRNPDDDSLRRLLKRHFKNQFVIDILLPFYPIARFLNVYLMRSGFRDRGPGLKYAALSAAYSIIKYAKYYEISTDQNPNSSQ